MATFKVKDPETGQTVRLVSKDDKPPTERELEEVFKNISTQRIEKQKEEFGEIGAAPPLGERLRGQVERKGALVAEATLGDVPFARQLLPERVREAKPVTEGEKIISGGAELGRDILLLAGTKGMSVPKLALRGFGFGAITADTEKPEDILTQGAISAITFPILQKSTEAIANKITKAAQKGLKSAQQIWQDLIRAGFTVEKSTVERVQQKGVKQVFSKKINPKLGVSNRDDSALLKVGEKIFNSAQKVRREAGKVLERWRNLLIKDKRVKVSVKNARDKFQSELRSPGITTLTPVADTPGGKALAEVDTILSNLDDISPDTAFALIDKLETMLSESKKGALSLSKNEGRIVGNLIRDLKSQVVKSAPSKISKGLESSQKKFSEVADITDDVFEKVPLRKQGVARKQRIGGTETNLIRGLKQTTPIEERNVYTRLDDILSPSEKFMELYQDVFAAQDLQREGIGFLGRRLLLSPRMAAAGLEATQPTNRLTGQLLKTIGMAGETVIPVKVLQNVLETETSDLLDGI